MSFLVGERGVVYEADLGEDTLEAAAAIESFDPGDSWEWLARVENGLAWCARSSSSGSSSASCSAR